MNGLVDKLAPGMGVQHYHNLLSPRIEFNSANTEAMDTLSAFADAGDTPLTNGRFNCLGGGPD